MLFLPKRAECSPNSQDKPGATWEQAGPNSGPFNKAEVWAWDQKWGGDLCQKVSFIVSLREKGYSGSFFGGGGGEGS